jgi:hypothetical protein
MANIQYNGGVPLQPQKKGGSMKPLNLAPKLAPKAPAKGPAIKAPTKP